MRHLHLNLKKLIKSKMSDMKVKYNIMILPIYNYSFIVFFGHCGVLNSVLAIVNFPGKNYLLPCNCCVQEVREYEMV